MKAQDWRHWQQRGRAHWRLLGEHARLVGPSARLLFSTETHTYAYSVAANCLLASLPFLFLMLWAARHLLPGLTTQQAIIAQLASSYLPAGQNQLVRDAIHLSQRHSVQLFSLLMLAISSSGVFLPLEVALNSIWGFKRNRSYVHNAVVALGLVIACGAIAYISIVLASLATAATRVLLPAAWTGLLALCTSVYLFLVSLPAAILVFFLIYWKLPNGKLAPAQVFPAALYTGLLAEVFKWLFPLVVPRLHFDAVYASLTLAVVVLLWGYISALLLLFGASLSARGIAQLPGVRVRLPHHAHFHAWYAGHPAGGEDSAAAGSKNR